MIGRDTRTSGPHIVAAVTAGARNLKCNVSFPFTIKLKYNYIIQRNNFILISIKIFCKLKDQLRPVALQYRTSMAPVSRQLTAIILCELIL